MKHSLKKLTGVAVLVAGGSLSACSGIGDGNGPKSMEIRIAGGVESAELFECITATPQALVTFDNGIAGDFFNRSGARWSSSDTSVLRVSDGTIPAAQEGRLYVNGILLPVKAGTATLTVKYLNFEDSIDVTVRPSRIELSPYEQTIVQGSLLLMRASAVLDGTESLSALDLGVLRESPGKWSVSRADGGTPATTIDPVTGVLSAAADSEGIDTVKFAVDFCNRSKSVKVAITNQTLERIELTTAEELESVPSMVSVPPDASLTMRVTGHYSAGHTQNLTGSSQLVFSDAVEGVSTVGFSGVRGSGVLTSKIDAAGLMADVTASFDPNTTVEGDELLSNVVTFKVLDVAMKNDGLSIAPLNTTMLQNSSTPFIALGSFEGTDGNVQWDLTSDVLWTSSNTQLMIISNTSGQRGLAISAATGAGTVKVGALRTGGDLEVENSPSTNLTIGAATTDDDAAEILALNISATDAGDPASVSRGTRVLLSAIADIGTGTDVVGTQNVSGLVVWSSSNENLAVVSNTVGSRGTVTVLSDAADRTVTITARYFNTAIQEADISGSIELQVNPSAQP